MDRIDSHILQILDGDARISNALLAERVGLSPSACLRRVQAMESRGIIKGYRAILDRAAMGGGFTIFVSVGLSNQSHASAAAFERAVLAAPEVRECHNVTGSIEYLLRVEVADLAAYKNFHANVLGEMPNVNSITSHICLASPKDERA
ncbi:MAG: Lrp/AsnC family transcriptional regulator [Woeseiaceae bacterium]|nr:Lrp/AsnC family transcriptional regulator [Woeseiaceae bacterium]